MGSTKWIHVCETNIVQINLSLWCNKVVTHFLIFFQKKKEKCFFQITKYKHKNFCILFLYIVDLNTYNMRAPAALALTSEFSSVSKPTSLGTASTSTALFFPSSGAL